MAGMTLKQMARYEFREALEAYRLALVSGTSTEIVRTSVRVWAARAGVPKSWHPLINRTYREANQ